ncbi:hypothetical protein M405DRAFT_836419 [Rhizopogon salebrosus TDB-379]|nr:hypothetical protein M405DRAFT_836419 [Rhizopogon salebrosus TDB-379]
MSPFPTGTTYGAYFFSTLLCAILWGMSCIQLFTYYTRLVNSASIASICLTRFSVMLETIDGSELFTINTAQTALVVHGAYAYLVTHFGNFLFFDVVLPISWVGLLLSTIVCVAVQGIFVVKAYRHCVVMSFRNESVTIYFSPSLKGFVISYLVVTAFVDTAIAYSIAKSLRKLNRYTVTVATSEMIRRLLIFSVFSGIWTALFAILVMITVIPQYLGFPDTAIFAVFDLPLCSLYCNTLLANLNSRDRGSTGSLNQLSTFRAATGQIVLSTIVGLQDTEFDGERDSIGMDDWK